MMPYTQQYVHAMRIAFAIICVIAAVSVGVGAVIITHQHNQIKAEQTQIKMTQLAIQQQRYEYVYRTCREQNHRNSKTIGTLKDIIRKIVKKHPEQAVQLAVAEKQNELLINALAPRQDCKAVAIKAVSKPPHPLPKLPALPPTTTTSG